MSIKEKIIAQIVTHNLPFDQVQHPKDIICCPYDDEIFLIGKTNTNRELLICKLRLKIQDNVELKLSEEVKTLTIQQDGYMSTFMKVCPMPNEKMILVNYIGKLLKIDLCSEKIVWERNYPMLAIAVDRRGIIYTGCRSGRLTLVDSLTGNELISHKLKRPIHSLHFDINDNVVIGTSKRQYLPILEVMEKKKHGYSSVKQIDFYDQVNVQIHCDYANKMMYVFSPGEKSIHVYSEKFVHVRPLIELHPVVGNISAVRLLHGKYLLVIGSIGMCILE